MRAWLFFHQRRLWRCAVEKIQLREQKYWKLETWVGFEKCNFLSDFASKCHNFIPTFSKTTFKWSPGDFNGGINSDLNMPHVQIDPTECDSATKLSTPGDLRFKLLAGEPRGTTKLLLRGRFKGPNSRETHCSCDESQINNSPLNFKYIG